MSAKNTLKSKQSRRQTRNTHKEIQDAKQGLQYRLIPLPNGGHSKFYGECATCYLRKMINLTQTLQQVNLDHSCKLEFLTQEQYAALDQTVLLYVERLRNDNENETHTDEDTGDSEDSPLQLLGSEIDEPI